MTLIQIPFSREMAIAAIEGKKIATTRGSPKGKIGDTFEVWHPDVPKSESCRYFATPLFRIIDIIEEDLIVVRNEYYRIEGFTTPEEFEHTWRQLHRGHFTTSKPYFVHFFAR